MPSNQLREERKREVLLPQAAGFAGIPALAEKFLPSKLMQELYRRVQLSADGFDLENLLAAMRVDLRVEAADAARIPASGPVVVVANHPFGLLDGAALAVLLMRVRPDVKVVTNFPLEDVPEFTQHCIAMDASASEGNSNSWKIGEANAWLREGGMLAIFPAGEVSHWQLPQAQISDPGWSDTAMQLIRETGASALPVYFCGRNSMGFHLFGMVHPKLRASFLLQEFLQQEGRKVEVRVGSVIPVDAVVGITDNREATEYLRWRTYLLARRKRAEISSSIAAWPLAVRWKLSEKVQQPVAAAEPRELLAAELEQLGAERRLAEYGDLAVYLVKANEAPRMLRELGRAREVTFRAAGEGTGKPRDLDRFDRYYWQLLLWNKTKQELVGGYRAGNTAEILAERRVRGLYTSTLFRYDGQLFEKIGPALELGRSFVRPEYQRQYAPLLLLWKGIARLLAVHPETPMLFGTVSISNDYSKASREMIFRFFEARMQNDELAGLIEPRRPFRPAWLRPWDCRVMCHALRDLEELSEPITDVEADGKGLPILLRQYAKIGGKLLGFNVDRKFSNVLDGLVMVDLRQTGTAVLERFMGREAAAGFRRHHGMQP
ncbi:MAG TPA: GNAT family N-acyltransferase [Candidatus Dormibacteraeota bacterium]|nr:GNAT family N-acyltransferase [Candidatus Dormibacteraeota bacterium]